MIPFVAALCAGSFIAGIVVGKRKNSRHDAQMRQEISRAVQMLQPRAKPVIDWSKSGGFAAVHNAGGSPEAITDDLIAYLWWRGLKIAPIEMGD